MSDEIKTPAAAYAQTSNLGDMYSETDLERAVAGAIARYTQDRANRVVGSFVGDGTSTYDLSAKGLTGWTEALSQVTEISYPYSAADENVLGSQDWFVIDDPTNGKTLYLPNSAPAATETVRIRYTAPWAEDTVPAHHVEAVAMLAAALYLRMLAVRMTQSGESTIQADSFDRKSNGNQFSTLADKYERQYKEIVVPAEVETSGGSSSSAGAAAVAVGTLDVGGNYGYGPMIEYDEDR